MFSSSHPSTNRSRDKNLEGSVRKKNSGTRRLVCTLKKERGGGLAFVPSRGRTRERTEALSDTIGKKSSTRRVPGQGEWPAQHFPPAVPGPTGRLGGTLTGGKNQGSKKDSWGGGGARVNRAKGRGGQLETEKKTASN